MTKRTIAVAALALALGIAGVGYNTACNKIGPKNEAPGTTPDGKTTRYEVPPGKPETPMFQMLRAAQDRDLAELKKAFAPSYDQSLLNEAFLSMLRKKVLQGNVTPVPESVQQISPTEAIVKLRNKKGGEIPVRVQSFDGHWLITEIDVKQKKKDKVAAGGGEPDKGEAVGPQAPSDANKKRP